MRDLQSVFLLLKLVAAVAAYWLSSVLVPSSIPAVDSGDVLISTLLPGLLFWLQDEIRHGHDQAWDPWLLPVDNFLVGTGLNLIFQALLSYALIATPLSGPATVLGSLFAAVGTAALTRMVVRPKRYLLVGIDQAMLTLATALPRSQVVGVVSADPARIPGDIPHLGGYGDIESVVDRHRPDTLVLSAEASVPAQRLLELRWKGVEYVHPAILYERYLGRVCASSVRARDVYMADSLFPFKPAMAIQAIYNNLIGLALLILFSPILAVFGLLTMIFSGPGLVFERVECIGFYRIPFHRLRFRTYDTLTGRVTAIGGIIRALRITRLPELINVVRGEIAFIGPAAVRTEHALRLLQMIPLYFQRFSVKPGLMSWRGEEGGKTGELLSEVEQLEFDLYYIKNTSFSLDIETVGRWIVNAFAGPPATPAPRPQE